MKLPGFIPGVALLAFTVALPAATPPGKTQQLTSLDQVPEGLAKSDWASIRAAYEAGRHAFQPSATGWQARNPGQQWTTKFDARGFLAEPKDDGWQWGLELKGYGFPGAERVISGVPAVKAEGQRLTYDWDAAVQEWFVNDARGLEHGFTVKERPEGNAERGARNAEIEDAAPSPVPRSAFPVPRSPLTFTLAVRGSLRPRITADAQGVEFRDAAGVTVLTYAGLKVWDADGKTLASRFVAVAAGVRLLVEERGARYPLTIDRIEILKEGASAVYGTDAIAGVINIILKTNYTGTEIESYIGNTTDMDALPFCKVTLQRMRCPIGPYFEQVRGYPKMPKSIGEMIRRAVSWSHFRRLRALNSSAQVSHPLIHPIV